MWGFGSVCSLVILLRQLALVSAGACPTNIDDAAAAHKAVSCVTPSSIEAAAEPVGHFTLNNIGLLSSSGATCEKKDGELKAVVQPQAGALSLGATGAASCSLASLALQKTETSTTPTVTLRLDFDKCSMGPASASVVMNVVSVPDAAAPTTMMPFWNQVCTKQEATPAPHMSDVSLTFNESELGNSTCDGTVLDSHPNVSTLLCRELCVAEVVKYGRSENSMEGGKICTAYSFNINTKTCNVYKGTVANITAVAEVGAKCYKMVAMETKSQASTPAPLTVAEEAAAQAKLPKLGVSVVSSQANIQTFVSPDKCFQPFSWMTLEDANQTIISVGVKQSEWATLMELIPVSTASARRLEASTLTAKVYADRAIYGLISATTPMPVAALSCPTETTPGDMTNVYIMVVLGIIALILGFCMGRGYHEGAEKSFQALSTQNKITPSPQAQQAPPSSQPLMSGASGPPMGGPSGGPSMGGPSGGPSMGGPSGGPPPSGPSGGPSPAGPSGGNPSMGARDTPSGGNPSMTGPTTLHPV